MRKLYNHNKGKIHPSPPPPPTTTTTDHLSLLPLAIATLAASLSPEDKEVLAYLLSCSLTTTGVKRFSGDTKPTTGTAGSHPPRFNCYCFSCYTSYWVRWDGSVNRQLIHEIIDAYEDELINNNNNNNNNSNSNKKNGKNKKDRKKNKVSPTPNSPHAPPCVAEEVFHAPPQVEENMVNSDDDDDDGDVDGQDGLNIATSSSEKGSVRKFVSFIGDRIWGVWGI
ncbi:uncharacterized protein LOC143618119 [Bidens hawaiensis]|uniref:uncharacterized protein LOC143618119 n=1 Tax=Bidens hawaiensis TaxID=980011 RepID=UPI0040494170